MIKIENVVLPSAEQWQAIIRGMRNPHNSWDLSDSKTYLGRFDRFEAGDADIKLMRKLANGGPVHAKYRRMIPVYMDITAPLYWWKEFDTYKVGTVANSCSTMHKIADKEFELSDFSHEHLSIASAAMLHQIIETLNEYRDSYLEGDGTKPPKDKFFWWQMIQLLPSSYNQKRTVMLNYEVLAGIYRYRNDHKLDEWREFCDYIKEMPYSEIITDRYGKNDDKEYWEKYNKLNDDLSKGKITLNEARARLGLEPIEHDI